MKFAPMVMASMKQLSHRTRAYVLDCDISAVLKRAVYSDEVSTAYSKGICEFYMELYYEFGIYLGHTLI